MTASSDWFDQARRLLDTVVQAQNARAAAEGGRTGAAHGADCTWCPVCSAAAVVRGERPEVTAALADLLTATATVLRNFAESEPPAGPDVAAAAEDGPETDPPPAVQRIEIG